jgi:hypothetical protein
MLIHRRSKERIMMFVFKEMEDSSLMLTSMQGEKIVASTDVIQN